MALEGAGNTSPLPLAGRVALVTGGSRGIGREVSSHLAALGARVVVNYASNSARDDELVAELASRGHGAVAVRADVSDPDAVRRLFNRAEEAFGSPPHIVVACAGLLNAKYPALADTAVEDFDAMFAVNVRGTFLVCREAASRIPAGSSGRIVTFSSSIVGTLLPGYAAYTATNAAVEAMTRILAKEGRRRGSPPTWWRRAPCAPSCSWPGRTRRSCGGWSSSPWGGSPRPRTWRRWWRSWRATHRRWVNGQVIRVNGGFV